MKDLRGLTIFEWVLMALMASLGIATKPIVVPLAHMVTGPLFIPGGAFAGGFYMFWLVLSGGLIGKRGVPTMTALIQALIIVVTGSFGSHGLISIVTYTLPGLMVDLVFLVIRRKWESPFDFFFAGMVANLTGTYLTNLVFFRLPWLPLVMTLASALLSGGIGGIIAYQIFKRIQATRRKKYEEKE
jgi:ABC-type thiamin/hydroxymethylpyrimidine transport system permease subunit